MSLKDVDNSPLRVFTPSLQGLYSAQREEIAMEEQMPRFAHPLDALRYHVTGAIERGEATPIVAITPHSTGVHDSEAVPGCPECDATMRGESPTWTRTDAGTDEAAR